MFVLISSDGDRPIRLMDVDNFRQLEVRIDGTTVDVAAQALSESALGEVTSDHAWLNVSILRSVGEDTDRWRSQFGAMIHYAHEQGWTDESATRVRAHIVTRRPAH